MPSHTKTKQGQDDSVCQVVSGSHYIPGKIQVY
jgi:hypothetical protein